MDLSSPANLMQDQTGCLWITIRQEGEIVSLVDIYCFPPGNGHGLGFGKSEINTFYQILTRNLAALDPDAASAILHRE